MTTPTTATSPASVAPNAPAYPSDPTLPGDPGPGRAWMAATVAMALEEDLGGRERRDVTTQATISPSVLGTADLVAREDGTVAGLGAVRETLTQVCEIFDLAPVRVEHLVVDGERVHAGQVLARLTGPVQALLVAERTMLNLASRASGVATAARAWTDVLDTVVRPDGSRARVLDTRKTTPGLRALDKYAVRCGGGTNKRMGLYDVAMIKDNHVVAAGSVAAAVASVRERFPDVAVQVEADTQAQAVEAVEAGADFLLLDNMDDDALRSTVDAVRALEPSRGRVELEATGNLSLERAASVAATGVDYMSVGALTHSAPILDLALDLRA